MASLIKTSGGKAPSRAFQFVGREGDRRTIRLGKVGLEPAREFKRKIEGLLEIIAASDATFLRNEGELTGSDFAAHLRREYDYYGPRNASVAEFIEKVASRSSITGNAYRIRLPDGQVADVAVWPREQKATTSTSPRGD